MFKIFFGVIIGAAVMFGYYYLNPNTYDITVKNNSGQIVKELKVTYKNSYCPDTCTLLLKNMKVGETKVISFQNTGSGDYLVTANLVGDHYLQTDHRQINNAGKQTELISADSIQRRY